MRRRLTSAAGLLVAGAAASAQAQFVSGMVVDSTSRRPLADVDVRLVRVTDTDAAAAAPASLPLVARLKAATQPNTTVVAQTRTRADGVFALQAPDTGRYRVRIGDDLLGPVLTLATGDAYSQAQYVVAPARASAFLSSQVTKHASIRSGTLVLRYPAELQERGTEGRLVVQFVVDATGRAEGGTFKVLESSDPGFAQAAFTAVLGARFAPAEVNGRPVRQLVQLPLNFHLTTGPASGLSRRSPALPPFGTP